MKDIKISASILNSDFLNLKQEINRVKPYTNWIHFDVMDGHFVDNISFGFPVLECLKNDDTIIKDVHIMIDNPLHFYKRFTNCNIDYLTFHYEALNSDKEIFDLIEKIKEENVKVGISIRPNTKIENIKKFLPLVDLILIMSVEPGFGGQKFMFNCLSKVLYLDYYRLTNNMNFLIEVDGGINNHNIQLLKEVGCDIAVVGSYLFKSDDLKKTFDSLK